MSARRQEGMRAAIESAGYTLGLLARAALLSRSSWKKRAEILSQSTVCGFGAFPVAMVVGAFTGMVLALQAGITLKTWGQEALIGVVVPASMVREMGPVMTAFILAGLVGSTMAAEIGTMAVSEEIDALEVMSINPVYYLVMPRVLALSFVTPVLTLYVDVVGILGGAFVGDRLLGLTYAEYMRNTLDTLDLKDIYSGLFKAFLFGALISSVGCAQGLRATGGAEGVGRATMRTVVICFVYILIFDYILTWLFYH
ncbi:MAG: ABC transporter permease [Candidatus Brocadiae bacterium]|nr:ABC transporter permease [Candidatus Brocadiia bacterium]